MNITSSAFQSGKAIPSEHTCTGKSTIPSLWFSGVPSDAESLAIIMDDPDAPGGLFTHWLIWNIPPQTQTIDKEGVPESCVQGRNDFGLPKYSGPCPPSGSIHRYYFRVYALDAMLKLKPNATRAELEKELDKHLLERVEIYGTYQR